ncbi:unnamed protein product [Soboliphyme baturini]|uniref:GRAM domain-containing protein n=1 Tax=Soboliphyme baturini TaxID=241478 RepID=A0A183IQ77_9BILA|nr:unnamed protein product [Soboliphyme baturini]
MALNTDQTPDGRGVVLFNGEVILIYTKTVNFELQSSNSAVTGKRKGPLYLTSHRIIFTNKNQSDSFKSFSMPFHCLRDVKVEQPVFGANFLKGVVLAQPNGNWEGTATFKLTFDEGGCIEFGQAMLHSVEQGKFVQSFAAPPPYVAPLGGCFCPPPAYYTCQGGVYNGVSVPAAAFPDMPPAHLIDDP